MRESYDSNLKKAMHLYAQKSAEDFPTDDVVSDITFSPAFEKKMDKEIRRRKHSYFRIFNTAAKRAASIAAILVLLLAVSLSVEAIRTPLTNMVKLIFSDHVELEAEGDVAETIVNIYGITELPEGFVLTRASENSVKISKDYKNAEGDELLFSQWATKFQYTAIDTEHSDTQTLDVDGTEVFVVVSRREPITAVYWFAEGYSFDIMYFGEIDTDSIIEMIRSVKVVGTYTETDQ